jgi:hypothetical protein
MGRGAKAPRARRVGTAILALVLLGAARGQAADGQDVADFDYENLSFRGLAPEWGYLWPDRVEETQSYGVRIDLGYIGPGLRITPSVMYWSSRLEDSEVSEFEDRVAELVADQTGDPAPDLDLGTIGYKDVAIGLDAHVVWEVPFDLLTFGGLGGTLHFVNGDGAAINGTFVEDLLDSIEPGFNLHLGAEYPITDRMRLYAAGRYEVMPDLQYLQVRVGWQFMFAPNAPGEGRND